jgi:polysaccharide pyruvyl transferase WcaK-like protein
MKIGIWGLYDKGNFGDDLMALLFASFLMKKNHDVLVYRASEFLNKEIGGRSVQDIERFTSECDVIIIGGGGMLVNNPWYKIFLKKTDFNFEYSFYKLLKSLKKYNKKIIPLSIGGGNANFINNPYKRKIFTDLYSFNGTVRLKSDLLSLNSTNFTYIPDVVLSSSDLIISKKCNSSKKVILLNLKTKNASELLDQLLVYGYFEKYDIYSFGSHAISHSKYSGYEYVLKNRHLQFNTIHEAINIISNADVIISSKLHVGVAGLSYNVPFISYKGPEKAKLFLKEINMNKFICEDSGQVIDLLKSITDIPDLEFDINNFRKESYRHFESLEETLKTLEIEKSKF